LGPGPCRAGGHRGSRRGLAMNSPSLVFEGVSYAYEEATREAVSDISLAVNAGEGVGVTGPTYSGKSTLCLLAVGLAPHFLGGRHPMELSGGQLQRLALAGLLAMRPKLLLLDEPTSQLDPAGTSAIFEVLQGLHQNGITIVMVEHRLETLSELCPRIVAIVA